MNQVKGKNWTDVINYAKSIREGEKVACKELQQSVERFFQDLENPDYWMDSKAPDLYSNYRKNFMSPTR